MGEVRATTSAPTSTCLTPSRAEAADTSIDAMRACGNGHRPTAMCSACAGATSSVKRPSPRSSRSSSLRSDAVPMPAAPRRGRSATSDIRDVAPDRRDNVLVARAPAQDAGQLLADLVARELATRARERRRGHEEPGGAEPALQGVRLLERLLQRREVLVGGEPLDGRHLTAVELRG